MSNTKKVTRIPVSGSFFKKSAHLNLYKSHICFGFHFIKKNKQKDWEEKTILVKKNRDYTSTGILSAVHGTVQDTDFVPVHFIKKMKNSENYLEMHKLIEINFLRTCTGIRSYREFAPVHILEKTICLNTKNIDLIAT